MDRPTGRLGKHGQINEDGRKTGRTTDKLTERDREIQTKRNRHILVEQMVRMPDRKQP